MTKKGLGRGMNAILGYTPEEAAEISGKRVARKKAAEGKDDVPRETSAIKLSLIEPREAQPRKNFDGESLKELADSIKEHGLLQPIVVRKKGGMYEIIAGERRYRAARMAGLSEIPAIVKEFDDRQAAEAALIENIQREDLGAVEEARAFRALIEEYGLKQEDLARVLSKSRTAITNSMRLLQLDDEVLKLIEEGLLTAGHARAILAVKGKRNQYKAAREVVNRGLSVRQAEKLARQYNSEAAKKKKEAPDEEEKTRALFIEELENQLTEAMQARVTIKETGKEKGRVEIEYYSEEALENLIGKLKGLKE